MKRSQLSDWPHEFYAWGSNSATDRHMSSNTPFDLSDVEADSPESETKSPAESTDTAATTGSSQGDEESEGAIIGIDLGTTNSAAAIMEAGTVEIIENAEGDRTTPSVVAKDNGEWEIGQPAKNKRVQNHSNTVSSVKRAMGDDVKFELEGEQYTPEQISAMVLRKVRTDVSEYMGTDIDRAVITVPAYFSDRQRQATKDAGEIAGFDVERIINEPTAAAMAYGIDEDLSDSSRHILVYDLGGGTFDVSILKVTGQMFEVKATKGDTELGGDDWDNKIVNWVLDRFEDKYGINLRQDKRAMQRIRDEAERAKMTLSAKTEVAITLPYIYADDDPLDVDETLTRTQFEDMCTDLVSRTTSPVQQALQDAGLTKDKIDDVLLIGGATRMPMIRHRVERLLGIEPRTDINPDEAVAIGAATQAGMINNEVEDKALIDVTPLSLGVEVKGGLFERIIPRNTTVPTRESKVFTTAEDEQDHVVIRVFQGERDVAEENVFLDEFRLTGIPPAQAGRPNIEVSFSIDKDGIVDVSAREESTGEEKSIRIEGGVGLDDDEIETMRQEAERKHQQDQQYRNLQQAENQLSARIREAEQILRADKNSADTILSPTVRDNLTELTSEAKQIRDSYSAYEDPLPLLQDVHDRFDDALSRVWDEELDQTALDDLGAIGTRQDDQLPSGSF